MRVLSLLKERWCYCGKMVQHEPRSATQDQGVLEGRGVCRVLELKCGLVLGSAECKVKNEIQIIQTTKIQ